MDEVGPQLPQAATKALDVAGHVCGCARLPPAGAHVVALQPTGALRQRQDLHPRAGGAKRVDQFALLREDHRRVEPGPSRAEEADQRDLGA